MTEIVKRLVYTGDRLREIAFPLGGIGTGTISLGGRGQLRDFEIANRFLCHRHRRREQPAQGAFT
jgi:uncharacterized protein (DUF608 family)